MSTAASAVSITAFFALLILHNTANYKTNNSKHDGTYYNCSHMILLSDFQ